VDNVPIRPENRDRYPKDWPAISLRIRERAGQKCEWCKAPNGELIDRSRDGESYMLMGGEVHSAVDGEYLGMCRGSEWPSCGRLTKVVLTVAHLDHTPENCADDNLAALCQRCHNRYDMPMRRAGIKERARKTLACGDLFP
jgi:5-methylcytosine-specific restriction endonuclease McrA